MYSQNFGSDPTQSTKTLVARQPKWERALDVLLSLTALVLVSPLVLIVTLLIKLVSHGPIIFKQERIGFGGKSFMIYKFRTMHIDAKTETHKAHTKTTKRQINNTRTKNNPTFSRAGPRGAQVPVLPGQATAPRSLFLLLR